MDSRGPRQYGGYGDYFIAILKHGVTSGSIFFIVPGLTGDE
jgi:hypothetical protein